MFFKYVTLWFAIHCVFIHTVQATVECLSSDADDYNCHFGSDTPYRFIANHNVSHLEYPGCTESKIWLMIRHGTRVPPKSIIIGMRETLPELREKIIERYQAGESLVPADVISKLREWVPTAVNATDRKILAAEGGRELLAIAERFQSRFPTLFPETFSNETFKFKYTFSERSEMSAKNFTFGLFGESAVEDVWYYPAEERDPILRPYRMCDRWLSEVDANPDSSEEVNLFSRSQIVNQTLEEISNVLGLTIDYETAVLIYMTCASETSCSETVDSPWCKLLSFDNFKVFEYVKDLDAYWQDGYARGYNITHELTCPTLGDMFQFFTTVSNRKATVYFSHSGMVMKLLTLLRMAKDEPPLTHDSFDLHRDNRAWRTSLLGPFTSNLAFVLYECEENGPSILFLLQERAFQIPGCPDDSPCPLSLFEELYSKTLHECDFKAICAI